MEFMSPIHQIGGFSLSGVAILTGDDSQHPSATDKHRLSAVNRYQKRTHQATFLTP